MHDTQPHILNTKPRTKIKILHAVYPIFSASLLTVNASTYTGISMSKEIIEKSQPFVFININHNSSRVGRDRNTRL